MRGKLFPNSFWNTTCVILLGGIDIILLIVLGYIGYADRDCYNSLGKEMQLGWALDLVSWPHPLHLLYAKSVHDHDNWKI